MEDVKTEYEKVISERKEVLNELNLLTEDEKVKRFIELYEKEKTLANKQNGLYNKNKRLEYSSCDHIWVRVAHDYDSWEGRGYDYHGCVKCGLDGSVLLEMESLHNPQWLANDRRIMYDYIRNNYGYYSGTHTDLSCDLETGMSLYKKIKSVFPEVDDDAIVKYLEVAINTEKESKEKKLTL